MPRTIHRELAFDWKAGTEENQGNRRQVTGRFIQQSAAAKEKGIFNLTGSPHLRFGASSPTRFEQPRRHRNRTAAAIARTASQRR